MYVREEEDGEGEDLCTDDDDKMEWYGMEGLAASAALTMSSFEPSSLGDQESTANVSHAAHHAASKAPSDYLRVKVGWFCGFVNIVYMM